MILKMLLPSVTVPFFLEQPVGQPDVQLESGPHEVSSVGWMCLFVGMARVEEEVPFFFEQPVS